MSASEPAVLPGQPRAVAALFALVAGALAMGVSPVMVRLADVGPYASAFWRVALAMPLLWAWARSQDDGGTIARAFGSRAVQTAGVIFTADLFFWHLAVMNTTVANATFLATTAPLWVVLGSWFLIGERVERSVFLGLLLCVGGGAVLLGSSYSLTPEHLLGDIYGVATSIFFGTYFLAVRVARRTTSAATVTFISSAITSAVLLVVALVMEPTILPSSWNGLAILLALAFISHAGGQGLLAYALGHLSAAFSSLVIFMEAIAAALVAWVVLGEQIGLPQLVGGILILAGIFIARPRS
ncbi:DMT family transporter [Chthonobacter albigriseus]|uniref:DMT family transporter n=1 Tax=Chthonobacter albigriseus TaxID=1683161 RepID=UPI0015EFC1AD|nr:DMT family transporter [Chthonobacter albigriseus]